MQLYSFLTPATHFNIFCCILHKIYYFIMVVWLDIWKSLVSEKETGGWVEKEPRRGMEVLHCPPGLWALSWWTKSECVSCRGMKWWDLWISKLTLKDRLKEGKAKSRKPTSKDAVESYDEKWRVSNKGSGTGEARKRRQIENIQECS